MSSSKLHSVFIKEKKMIFLTTLFQFFWKNRSFHFNVKNRQLCWQIDREIDQTDRQEIDRSEK